MAIAVYGASGHTGRFVLAEMLQRKIDSVAIARDESTLKASSFHERGIEARVASVDDARSLDRALRGVDAVINCAGPFLDTAEPLVEAALRARIHYLDVTAEQASALSTFEAFDQRARATGVVVSPAAGFYGGLGDLLATSAMGDWTHADEILIAIALDSWWPTQGTRRTGARNTVPRVVRINGSLEPVETTAPAPWSFSEPFGTLDVVQVPFSEIILMARHLNVPNIRNFINEASMRQVRDPATPAPVAVDERGRSNQTFLMEAAVRRGGSERRAAVRGRDIYAITASLVVEASERICAGRHEGVGARALGELFDATDFLLALSPEHLAVSVHRGSL